MSTYAIGDVQGCFLDLQALLLTIAFKPEEDCLWFVGDIVNRGPQSLATLRFIKSLPNVVVVLGNHDLHLLALGYGQVKTPYAHTLDDVLKAEDCMELLAWLRCQPFLYHDAKLNYVMVHAGILPTWALDKAKSYASELTAMMQGDDFLRLLATMYGDLPNCWSENLISWDRWRFMINVFTRMRFCSEDGVLDLTANGDEMSAPFGFFPWFKTPGRIELSTPIIFGHWAALEGRVGVPNVYGLDTGCVWGRHLTALRLEDQRLFSVPCRSNITKL